MRFDQYIAVATASLASSALGAKCTANKVIDNFATFANKTNTLQSVSGGECH